MACAAVQDMTFDIKYGWMSKRKYNVERENNTDISTRACTCTFYAVLLKDALMNEQFRGACEGGRAICVALNEGRFRLFVKGSE